MFVEIEMKNALCLVLILLFSCCASIDPALLTGEEMVHVVGLARGKVASEISDLSERELHFIKSEQPRFSYYRLSGNYANYSVCWEIKDNQGIIVSGRGDIMTLEGAKVERFMSSGEFK